MKLNNIVQTFTLSVAIGFSLAIITTDILASDQNLVLAKEMVVSETVEVSDTYEVSDMDGL